jgi:hypothetical protein
MTKNDIHSQGESRGDLVEAPTKYQPSQKIEEAPSGYYLFVFALVILAIVLLLILWPSTNSVS